MNQPTAEERMAHDMGLLREMRAASSMRSRLTAAGFDDIYGDTLFIFAATCLFRRGPNELAQMLGMDEKNVAQTIDELIKRGHLNVRPHPKEPGQTITTASKRSFEAVREITSVIRTERWADFPFRQGDIVISTLPKSGTTWMQMICALLIFQTTDLPGPLRDLSIHLDSADLPGDQVMRLLDAQQHRRFIKTHITLDEIPFDSGVTYIVVARNPLDMILSAYRQRFQWSKKRPVKRSGPVSLNRHGLPADPTPHEWLLECIDSEDNRQDSIPGIMRALSAAWTRRNEPNVMLVHYEDLSADLEGQMRRVAACLGITIPEDAWPALAKAATFEQMRSVADRVQPLARLDNPEVFFHSGTSGSGRELLTSDELAHYHDRAGQWAPADLLAWLHRQ